MSTIKDWMNRFIKQNGIYLTKERIIQEIRKTNRNSLPVEYKEGQNVLIIAIPVPTSFQI